MVLKKQQIKLKLIILVLCFSTGFNHVLCQTDYRPGYFISNTSDTVHGLVDYRGDIRNSKVCSYKKDEGSEVQTFNPGEIKAYRYNDGKFYISRVIKTPTEEKKVFVEYLLNGVVDLFYYADGFGGHYLIELPDGKLTELIKEEKLVYIEGKGDHLKQTNKHIGLLKVALADCPEIQKQIEEVDLSHKSLISLTKQYHDYKCDGEKCIIYEKKMPVLKVRFAPLLGISVSDFNFFENDFLTAFDFDNSFSPTIGFLFNFSLQRLNEKLSFQIGAEVSRNYYYSFQMIEENYREWYYDYHIHTMLLNPDFAFKYTYPKGKIRPTISIGAMACIPFQENTRIVEEQVNSPVVETSEYTENLLPSSLFGPSIGLGCDVYISKRYIVFGNFKYHYVKGKNGDIESSIQSISFSIGLYL